MELVNMKANMLQNVFTIIVKYKKKVCAEKSLNSKLTPMI